MEKLKLHTPDTTEANIEKLAALFPQCVTEAVGEDGKLTRAINFDQLRQELSDHIIEGPRERYQLTWPGKKEAVLAANAPIAKTLRPSPEESVDFGATKNLFVEGDNLDALRLMRETYLAKVRLIYIDPPYNTGSDHIYSDVFAEDASSFLIKSNQVDEQGNRLIANRESNGRFHSDWLSMMYSRLLVARNLLADDGIIVVSIDENEHGNLKKVCDEVFGSQNFCGEIVWKNSSKNDQSYVSIQHEYFVVYVKDKQTNKGEWVEKKQGLDEIYAAFEGFKKKLGTDWEAIHKAALEWYKQFPASDPISDSKHYSWMDERGVYFPSDISGPNDGQYVYDVPHPTTGKPCKMPASGWRYPQTTMMDRIAQQLVHFGSDHKSIPNNKTYLKDTEYQSLTSMRFVDGRAASKRLQTLFGVKVFTNPKDEFLLKDLFKAMRLKNDDIVLDYFGGSGSTAHAIFELNKEQGSNCRCITVQIDEDLHQMHSKATGSSKKVAKNAIDYLKRQGKPQNISEIAKERLRLAGKQVLETDCHEGWSKDIGFRVLKIDASNMREVYYSPDQLSKNDLLAHVDNIREGRTAEDLLFQVLIDWGVDLSLPISKETIDGKVVYFVDENALAACFEQGVNEELVKKIAARKPLRVVFRDNGFSSDSVKINVEQIFKLLSPVTDVKSI